MVSKSTKRTPLKSIWDCRNHQRRPRRKSPEKNASSASPSTVASSAIIKSINRSVFACKRRLLKIFSKLACVGTPSRQQQFKILKNSNPLENHDEVEPLIRRPLVFDYALPPLLSPEKRTVFLDLDETLIHSKADPPPERFDFIVRPLIDGEVMNFYVLKRPGVNKLLRALGQKFEVVVFTAAVKEYASLVIDKLDPRGFISHRLYRDSCKEIAGKFVKDLSDIGRDLRKAVIVDDNPNSFSLQPENGIPIRPFTGDINDRELEKLMKFFEVCDSYEDIRDAVKNYVSCSANMNLKKLLSQNC